MNELLATPRDLEELGLAGDRIQAIPIPRRRRCLRAASAVLFIYLRKRNDLLVPRFDPEDFDTAGMTGGATPEVDLGAGPSTVQDVRIVFTAGTVGQAGITYAVDANAGAWGSVPGPALSLGPDGAITVDRITFTLPAGRTVADGDSFTYSTRVDAGVARNVAKICAADMLIADGIDPVTKDSLEKEREAAIAWAKDLAGGEGELAAGADRTPTKREGGIRFCGQSDPYEWARQRRRRS